MESTLSLSGYVTRLSTSIHLHCLFLDSVDFSHVITTLSFSLCCPLSLSTPNQPALLSLVKLPLSLIIVSSLARLTIGPLLFLLLQPSLSDFVRAVMYFFFHHF